MKFPCDYPFKCAKVPNIDSLTVLTHKSHVRPFFLCQMERDGAMSLQLRGQYGSYGMYVAVTGCTGQHSHKCHIDPVITK